MVLPEDIPKNYDFTRIEERWQQVWKDEDNTFNPDSEKPPYIIDTPPPYPTGNFHIGNAFNWCYIDFIARYRRMRGYNVMFPQGWDCHGLPTEVKVEEIYHITKNDVPRDEFRELCRTLTLGNIEKMRATMRRCGFSIDWSREYITMLPEYFGKTQLSFLRMLEAEEIYQSEHPVNFCTRCETAIAFAEVAYEDRETTLNYVLFDGIEIATTRPELLAACVAVAVHPEDERYRELSGRTLKVPIFCHQVPVVKDEAVDPSFGSGAVMICTFGDKQDVHWWKKHDLELRKAIDRQGRMTATAGPYAGLSSKECRQRILGDMEKAGILKRSEKLQQRVGTCWRCKTPIEIMSERQWFVRIHPDQIMEAARKVAWVPQHMFTRLENWVEQMEWDWCISRQRIFATPIPVWFCAACNTTILPAEEDLPVDPVSDRPKRPCPACGGTEVVGEEDVLDTWMDSSISVLRITEWDGKEVPLPFPAQLRPQGHDIIRTWAFYTILRSVALTGKHPWEEILINGMVLGDDGFKMSKSRGNIIAPEEVLIQHGADAFRQWSAAGAATGSDIMFSWNDIVAAQRFQTKLWNILRFVVPHLGEEEQVTELTDRWLLARLNRAAGEVTDAMETCQFDRALKVIREFVWADLADNYIELVKGRLYSDAPGRASAAVALRIALDAIFRMLAPFTPFFAEECFSYLSGESVHRQGWPGIRGEDPESLQKGDLVARVVSEVRRYKHDRGMALNAPMKKVVIYTPFPVDDAGDAARALNADVEWRCDAPMLDRVQSDIRFDMSVIGPRFRGKARAFMEAVRGLPAEELEHPPETVVVDGEPLSVPEGAFSPEFSYTVEGEKVDLIEIGADVIVTVRRSS
ncbi:MAG: valine--tRNA ligase [Methanomicrobiaceae archaeon]|nr:valine--tRNA ligase [Methanomicrobiaceae archaeon]